jgi:hypothetical protein
MFDINLLHPVPGTDAVSFLYAQVYLKLSNIRLQVSSQFLLLKLLYIALYCLEVAKFIDIVISNSIHVWVKHSQKFPSAFGGDLKSQNIS